MVHPILTDQDRVAILRKCMYSEPTTRLQIEDLLSIAKKYIPSSEMDAYEKMNCETIIHAPKFKSSKKDYGFRLLHYLEPSHIQIFENVQDWQQALKLSCQPLLQAGSITQDYIDAILYDQKERQLYMFLCDGLVLAHSNPQNGVNQIDVALSTFKEPITFMNGRQAQIIIAMCATDQTKHIKILNDIIEIFSKKKSLDAIVSMNQKDEIYNYIKKFELHKIYEVLFIYSLTFYYS